MLPQEQWPLAATFNGIVGMLKMNSPLKMEILAGLVLFMYHKEKCGLESGVLFSVLLFILFWFSRAT